MSIPGAGGTGGSAGAAGGGPRLGKKPALVGVAMAGLFLVAFVYAVVERSKREVAEATPESVFDVAAGGSDVTDFLAEQRDGLVGVNRNDIGEPAGVPARTSDFDDRLAQWMEGQQLQKLQVDDEMRERLAAKQLESYERALAASSRVDGFERRERRDESAGRAPDLVVPAAAPATGAATGGFGTGPGPYPGPDRTGLPASAGGDAVSAILATPEARALLASPQGRALAARLGLGGGTGAVAASAGSVPAELVPVVGQALIDRTTEPSEFVLEAGLEPPRSPYELKTGALIPAAMISAANSELPGDILAQVTHDVHDTASGRFVLIPRGTKLFGRYDAYTALGQERLLIAWNRLVFPDGETLDIGGMQGHDERGLAGFRDRVSTHFLKTLGNAFLLSLVSSSGEALVAAAGDRSSSPTFTLNLAQDFSDTSGAAFEEYLRNRLRIRPTLEIRAGYRFDVLVSRDIDLPGPYERGFDAYRTSR